MSNDIKAVKDMVEVMMEKLRTIRYEANRLITDCECVIEAVRHMETADAIGQDVEPTVRTVNPMQAPEIEGADKAGDGGFAVSIGQAPRER